MAKLSFRYGTMNSGKSTILIQIAYNFEENEKKVIVIKPAIDTKGNDYIVSRIGAKRRVDELIFKEDKVIDKVEKYFDNLSCILVDEAQFLEKSQVDELFCISKIYNIPVIAFGLRTDFKTNSFTGSQRLLELADELMEIVTICRCGKKARFIAIKANGKFMTEGESVIIDDGKEKDGKKIKYIPMCGKCYLKKVLKR